MCFSDESWFCDALACTGAPRPLPTPQPAHRTKGSLDLASSEVTRIATRSAFWEHAAGATGATGGSEVVARPAARTPHPTRARGQDDGSYTNFLKQKKLKTKGQPGTLGSHYSPILNQGFCWSAYTCSASL